jgi:aspartyl-tRNA(Asn)/glutamyl-tRNA(Gln) amidotransferase subunit B
MPGTLPVLNRTAVEFGIRVGLALGCEIMPTSIFARKNYFTLTCPRVTRSHSTSTRWR